MYEKNIEKNHKTEKTFQSQWQGFHFVLGICFAWEETKTMTTKGTCAIMAQRGRTYLCKSRFRHVSILKAKPKSLLRVTRGKINDVLLKIHSGLGFTLHGQAQATSQLLRLIGYRQ